MSQSSRRSLGGQWIVAILMTALLAGGLGVGLRRLMSPSSHHLPLPRWGGLSDTDKVLATHAVQTYYQDLKGGAWRQSADVVTPPPAPDVPMRAVTWLSEGLSAQNTQAESDFRTCASQVQALGWAVEQWSTDQDDNGDLPRTLDSLVPTYFKTLPTCPADPGAHYHYQCSPATGRFTVYCDGRHHTLAGGAADSPEYSSTFGLSCVHAAGAQPRLTAFSLVGLAPDGQQAVATVQEQWQLNGKSCTTTSSFHVTPAGPEWKIVLPEAGSAQTPAQAVSGKGLGEAYLVSLAGAPHWFATASCAQDKLTACSYNLQRLAASLDAYASDHDGEYPAHLADLVPHYLRELPTCPVDGGAYADGYEAHGDDYALCCPGGRHVGCSVPDGYPRIDNTTGLLLHASGAASAPELHASVH